MTPGPESPPSPPSEGPLIEALCELTREVGRHAPAVLLHGGVSQGWIFGSVNVWLKLFVSMIWVQKNLVFEKTLR